MKRPKLVTVVLVAHGVEGAIASVVRDLAVAAYLLNYATDRAELGAMCRGIARCLRPGGRFVRRGWGPGRA